MELGENLLDCVRYDEIDDVRELITVHNANVNYSDEYGKCPLHIAAANGLFFFKNPAALFSICFQLVASRAPSN